MMRKEKTVFDLVITAAMIGGIVCAALFLTNPIMGIVITAVVVGGLLLEALEYLFSRRSASGTTLSNRSKIIVDESHNRPCSEYFYSAPFRVDNQTPRDTLFRNNESLSSNARFYSPTDNI